MKIVWTDTAPVAANDNIRFSPVKSFLNFIAMTGVALISGTIVSSLF